MFSYKGVVITCFYAVFLYFLLVLLQTYGGISGLPVDSTVFPPVDTPHVPSVPEVNTLGGKYLGWLIDSGKAILWSGLLSVFAYLSFQWKTFLSEIKKGIGGGISLVSRVISSFTKERMKTWDASDGLADVSGYVKDILEAVPGNSLVSSVLGYFTTGISLVKGVVVPVTQKAVESLNNLGIPSKEVCDVVLDNPSDIIEAVSQTGGGCFLAGLYSLLGGSPKKIPTLPTTPEVPLEVIPIPPSFTIEPYIGVLLFVGSIGGWFLVKALVENGYGLSVLFGLSQEDSLEEEESKEFEGVLETKSNSEDQEPPYESMTE